MRPFPFILQKFICRAKVELHELLRSNFERAAVWPLEATAHHFVGFRPILSDQVLATFRETFWR
ncbi:hypothetical protein SPHV1_2430084 [Novosphingobium sp. KN65.2]|nr:hypothetical protein SPHV1_2430084 [Novosphingobium sp. KN65.2]